MTKKFLAIAALASLVTGCSTTTPHYDARFGDAVRDAKRKMTINPEAGKKRDEALGLDGRASRETMQRYQDSYKEPPPAVNVINIGGSLGSSR